MQKPGQEKRCQAHLTICHAERSNEESAAILIAESKHPYDHIIAIRRIDLNDFRVSKFIRPQRGRSNPAEILDLTGYRVLGTRF